MNDSTVLLLSLRFHYLTTDAVSAPMAVRDSTVAEFVAVNRKIPSIFEWNSIKAVIRDLDIDGMSLLTGASIPAPNSQTFMSAEASLTLLAVIFFVLLTLIMTILGIMLCYYRNKFKVQKNNLVEARIAAATRAPLRHWSPYLERPPELLWERSPSNTTGSTTPERRASYSVQEMKIAVN